MSKVKVSNMTSPRSGRDVPNQFIIETDEGEYFQSYQSIIVFIPSGTTCQEPILDINKWDYSNTTSRYRNEFLDETTKETKQKIKDGTYILKDLN